jgi:hypothetical protein
LVRREIFFLGFSGLGPLVSFGLVLHFFYFVFEVGSCSCVVGMRDELHWTWLVCIGVPSFVSDSLVLLEAPAAAFIVLRLR